MLLLQHSKLPYPLHRLTVVSVWRLPAWMFPQTNVFEPLGPLITSPTKLVSSTAAAALLNAARAIPNEADTPAAEELATQVFTVVEECMHNEGVCGEAVLVIRLTLAAAHAVRDDSTGHGMQTNGLFWWMVLWHTLLRPGYAAHSTGRSTAASDTNFPCFKSSTRFMFSMSGCTPLFHRHSARRHRVPSPRIWKLEQAWPTPPVGCRTARQRRWCTSLSDCWQPLTEGSILFMSISLPIDEWS